MMAPSQRPRSRAPPVGAAGGPPRALFAAERMNPNEPAPRRTVTPKALETFDAFLARRARGESVDFESFCAEHADVGDELRVLHAHWLTESSGAVAGPRSASSIAAYLARKFDADIDPNISLDAPRTESPEDEKKVRGRLSKLAQRANVASRYVLRGELARGGMGRILQVWDEDLRRTLAMKVVLGKEDGEGEPDEPDVDPQTLRRFLEEAQITGQLDHPGIVPVHELGVDDHDRVFFTIRLVKGRDLAEIFRLARAGEEGWNQTRAVGAVLRVCEAMAYAHSKRVIHRDLKPENVMVGRYGETYVMDWGLAKVLGRADSRDVRVAPQVSVSLVDVETGWLEGGEGGADEPLRTLDGTVVGTPAYMPPEQAEGRGDKNASDLGPWSDVYSVGAILYTLLAGRAPYVPPDRRVSPQRIVFDLIKGPPVPIPEIEPAAPPELVAICDKAMARDMSRRYPDMMAMAEDLRAYLEGRVVGAYEAGAVAQLKKWVLRNKATAAAMGGLIVTLVGSLFAFILLQKNQVDEIRTERNLTAAGRDLAEESAERAKRNERSAVRKSYVANVVAADASIRANEVVEAKRRLDDCDPELRGWEWRHLHLRSDSSRRVLEGHGARVSSVAWSADGATILSGSEDKTIRAWDPVTGLERFRIPDPPEGIDCLAISPDGRWIAAGVRQDTALWLFDARLGKFLATLPGHDGSVTAVAFSPDSARIASGSSDGSIRIWNVSDRTTARRLDVGGRTVQGLAFDAGGSRIAAGLADGATLVFALDRADDPPLELASESGAAVHAVAFSPDGARVAAACFDAIVRVFDAGTGETIAPLRGHGDPVFSVAFIRDGSAIVSGSLDRTVRVWDAASRAPLAVLRGHEGAVWSVAAAPDGRRIVSGASDGTLRIWDTRQADAVRVLRGNDDFVSSVAFAPDGKKIVAGSHFSGTVQVFDAESGAEILSVPGAPDAVNAVAFDPSGSRIAAGVEEGATIVVRDAATGKTVDTLAGHDASVTSLAYFPDGKSLVSGSADNTAIVWDLSIAKPRHKLAGHDGRVTGVAVSRDGRMIATASFDRAVRLFDAESGTLVRTIPGHEGEVRAVAFDPSGALVVSGSADDTARVWETATGDCRHVLRGHSGDVHAVAFGPSGRRIATGGFDKTLRIWEADSGESLLTLRGHDGWVTALAYSPDGSRIASSSFDDTVRVWEAEAEPERAPR